MTFNADLGTLLRVVVNLQRGTQSNATTTGKTTVAYIQCKNCFLSPQPLSTGFPHIVVTVIFYILTEERARYEILDFFLFDFLIFFLI